MTTSPMPTLPVLSLDELRHGRQREMLHTHARELGVFYLRDCGMSDDDHRLAMTETQKLFATITPEERVALTTKIASIRRGYSGLEAESTALVTNNGDYTDYSMTYSMGLSHNLFPSPRFEQVWTEYFQRYYAVARDTARAILQTVGVRDGIDIEALLDCDPVMRLKCFPEVPEHRASERVPMRIAPHYDLSIITLIHQTPCPNGFVSLEAEAAGRWVELPSVPGTVVVLCGAVTTLTTSGKVPAPRHQVAAPPSARLAGSDRTSSVFFLRPAPGFAFSVSEARRLGFNVSLTREHATFGDWVGNNYTAMHGTARTASSSDQD